MPSFAGLRDRLKEYRPTVVSTFIVARTTEEPYPDVAPDESTEIRVITDANDPVVENLASGRRLKYIRRRMSAGDWIVTVAIKNGKLAGWIWETTVDERSLSNGLIRARLAPNEHLLFDLWVEPEHRRGNLAWIMGRSFFDRCLADPDWDRVYGFIAHDNVPSILWHHSVGFTIVQTCNMLHIGPRIKWKLPFSDMPRVGPVSKKGVHSDPDTIVFGPPLMP